VIDWLYVARHAVWIAGAALWLASWSWSRVLPHSLWSRIGTLLFCIGMASVSRWWEALLWLGLGLVGFIRWTR